MSYSRTVFKSELDAFKATWPCHGIASNIAKVWFQWDDNGDLIDVRACYRNGRVAAPIAYDGPAILALCADMQREMHPEHAANREG